MSLFTPLIHIPCVKTLIARAKSADGIDRLNSFRGGLGLPYIGFTPNIIGDARYVAKRFGVLGGSGREMSVVGGETI